jgi:hypothetical protein
MKGQIRIIYRVGCLSSYNYFVLLYAYLKCILYRNGSQSELEERTFPSTT